MRVLMVLDHPYTLASADNTPHQRSFTAAVATAADLAAWRQARVVDPQVADYQRRLLDADHLVFAFPVWWEAMSAATKGFLDRVLTQGLMFAELPAAKGNPFRNLMSRLGGATVLSVMTKARSGSKSPIGRARRSRQQSTATAYRQRPPPTANGHRLPPTATAYRRRPPPTPPPSPPH